MPIFKNAKDMRTLVLVLQVGPIKTNERATIIESDYRGIVINCKGVCIMYRKEQSGEELSSIMALSATNGKEEIQYTNNDELRRL